MKILRKKISDSKFRRNYRDFFLSIFYKHMNLRTSISLPVSYRSLREKKTKKNMKHLACIYVCGGRDGVPPRAPDTPSRWNIICYKFSTHVSHVSADVCVLFCVFLALLASKERVRIYFIYQFQLRPLSVAGLFSFFLFFFSFFFHVYFLDRLPYL